MTLTVQPGTPFTRLLPAGIFNAPRGALAGKGPWMLTAVAAQRLIALARGRSSDIPVDYEHQILLSEKNGHPAPAAGWVKPQTLAWVESGPEPGVYGEIKWTERASVMIDSGEYRYLSPVFAYNAASGEVLDLLHLALTQIPAIDTGRGTAVEQAAASQGHGAPVAGARGQIAPSSLGAPCTAALSQAELEAAFAGDDRGKETFLRNFGALLGLQ